MLISLAEQAEKSLFPPTFQDSVQDISKIISQFLDTIQSHLEVSEQKGYLFFPL